MNNSSEQNNFNDEINFGPLINWVKKVLLSLSIYLRKKVLLIRKHSKTTLIGIAFGSLIGIIIFFVAEPIYKSEMILTSKGYTSRYIQDRIQTLSDLVDKTSIEAISDILEIDIDQAEKIESIGYSNFDLKQALSDSINNNLYFKIIVETTTNDILEPLNYTLLKYLRKNNFSSLNRRLQKDKFLQQIEAIKKDIIKMDRLKDQVEENIGSPTGETKGFVFGEPLNPIDFYNESFNLHEKKLNLEISVQLMENVEIVNEFYINNRRVFPRYRHILLFSLFGLIASTIFILSMKKE